MVQARNPIEYNPENLEGTVDRPTAAGGAKNCRAMYGVQEVAS